MWSIPFLAVIAIFANSQAFIVEPQDEAAMNFKETRALLTPEQEQFLEELLAADDAMIAAATSRGIVDDVYGQILQALSGVGSGNVRINIVGTGNQQPQQAAPATQAPTVFKALENNPSPASPGSGSGAPTSSPVVPDAPAMPQANPNNTAIGGNNNHLFMTISSVIMNSNRRNVTGIVEDSLRIATPGPIRDFVTGILNVVYCNSVRRLLGRC